MEKMSRNQTSWKAWNANKILGVCNDARSLFPKRNPSPRFLVEFVDWGEPQSTFLNDLASCDLTKSHCPYLSHQLRICVP